MLGIYAKSFMMASGFGAGADRAPDRKPGRDTAPAGRRRWKAPGYWIDPPEEF